jgi:D-arabinose 1-dehydrogenase-like Zn-dependent alcohol dehydrogenase
MYCSPSSYTSRKEEKLSGKEVGHTRESDLCVYCLSGTDVAGEVVSLGPGVKTLAVGDKVSSWLSFKKVHDSDLNMVTYNTCSSGIDGR